MSKIVNIIKSKLKNKDNLGDWYIKRVETCLNCQFLSSNKEQKTAKDIFWKIANLGEENCTVCGCGVKDKASIEDEYCPKGKWLAVDRQGKQSIIPILNLSEDKVVFDYYPKQGYYLLDYGQIKVGSDSKVRLLLKTDQEQISGLRVQTSCGCTQGETIKTEEGYQIEVSYKTRLGGIKQTAKLLYKDSKNTLRQITIKLTGQVK